MTTAARPDPTAGGPGRAPGWRARGSLARIASIGLAVAIVASVAGAGAVTIGFRSLLDARSRLFDQLQPALVQSQQLTASLVDQETGVRGYALTRDARLLEPYVTGRRSELGLVPALRGRLSSGNDAPALLRRLVEVEHTMAAWRHHVARPLIAEAPPKGHADAVFLDAKRSFDHVRTALALLTGRIQADLRAARQALDDTTVDLVVLVALAILALTLVAVGGAWVLRRRVVRPVGQLGAAADAVVAGRFADEIAIEGPMEIEHLSQQMVLMRDRIVAQLATVEEANVELQAWAEELARSNADLEQFAYVASHDLQEPLRKVTSFCQLLDEQYGDALDQTGREYLAFAVDGASRMQALIADLLEFSRVGRSVERLVPCDLDAIARAAAADLAAGPGEVVVEALPTVAGDASLYRALFANLLGNAVKYRSPDRPLRVVVRAELTGSVWSFTCTDEGIGIEPRFHERVFVIFQRLHGRNEYEGTGIGLALCKKIVEFCGGRIWIGAPPGGVGTQVCWTLPVHAPASPVRPFRDPLDQTGTREPA